MFSQEFGSVSEIETDLKKNYDNIAHPISHSGVTAIRHWYRNKISVKKIEDILAQFESYTLHREIKNGKRNPTFIYLPRWRMEIDLLDVGNLSQHNDNIKFIVMLIDCWTRKLWTEPITRKLADEVLAAVKQIFLRVGKTPKYLGSDRGLEFTNKKMQEFCKKKKIKFTPNFNYVHSAFVERANRTFQKILHSWMTENETFKYLPYLQQLTKLYNIRSNRTMKMSPEEAEKKANHVQLRLNMELHYNKFMLNYKKKPRFSVGDVVRIAKSKEQFHRSYDEQSQLELFKISKINTRLPIPTYTLTNWNGSETLVGNFYEFEMVYVRNDDGIYRVDYVVETRVRKKKKQYLVKWKGFGPEYNSWVDQRDIKKEFR